MEGRTVFVVVLVVLACVVGNARSTDPLGCFVQGVVVSALLVAAAAVAGYSFGRSNR